MSAIRVVSRSELLTGRLFRVPGKRKRAVPSSRKKRSDLQEKFRKKDEQVLVLHFALPVCTGAQVLPMCQDVGVLYRFYT